MDNDWRNARIEEAAKAMHGDDIDKGRAGDDYSSMNPETLDWYRDNARAALAVFEKAQGEPSDAKVMAAIQVFYNAPGVTDWVNETKEDMRAALRAAGEVR